MARRLVALTVALVLLATVATPLAAQTRDAERLELDDTHPLADGAAVDAYQEDGEVVRPMERIQANLAYVDDLGEYDAECGETPEPGRLTGAGTQYLVIDYCEDIDRTLRLNLPRGYFSPISGTKSTLAGDEPVTYQPVDGRNATAIEVTIRERGVVAIPVSATDRLVFGTAADWRHRFETVFNVTIPVPGLDGGQQWRQVDGDVLESRGTVPIDGHVDEVLVQYRETVDGETAWVNAPERPRDSSPVYVQARDGTNQTVWIVPQTDAPPDVRYKPRGDTKSFLGGVVEDTKQLPSEILESLPF